MAKRSLSEMRTKAKNSRKFLAPYEKRLEVLNVNNDPTKIQEDLFIYKKNHEKFFLELSDIVSIGTSQNFIISGKRGTGKTSLTRFFADLVKKDLKEENKNIGVLYVDCRNHYKKVGIFEELLGKERKGGSFSSLERDFKKYIDTYDRMIVILDEADSLAKIDAKDVLFTLASIPKITLVVTSLTGKILDNIQSDPSVVARFNPDTFPFYEYTQDEIKSILVKRLTYVFEWKKNDIKLLEDNIYVIAGAIVEKLNSDLRIGMDAVVSFVKNELIKKEIDFREIEGKEWVDDFEKCIIHAKKKFHKRNLTEMNSRDLLMMFSIALFPGSKAPSIADAYQEFENLCNDSVFDVKLCSKRQYENYINTFALYELLTKEPKRRGRSTIKVLMMAEDKRELVFEVLKDKFSLTDDAMKIYKTDTLVKPGSDLLDFSIKKTLRKNIASKFADYFELNKRIFKKKYFVLGNKKEVITKEYLGENKFEHTNYKVIEISEIDKFATSISFEVKDVLKSLMLQNILVKNPTTKIEYVIMEHNLKPFI